MKYVIRCINNPELFWSNIEGYTDLDYCDIFTLKETIILSLPIEGEWLEMS